MALGHLYCRCRCRVHTVRQGSFTRGKTSNCCCERLPNRRLLGHSLGPITGCCWFRSSLPPRYYGCIQCQRSEKKSPLENYCFVISLSSFYGFAGPYCRLRERRAKAYGPTFEAAIHSDDGKHTLSITGEVGTTKKVKRTRAAASLR